MALEEFRFNKFKREIELRITNVTAVKCQEWENHAMSYVPRFAVYAKKIYFSLEMLMLNLNSSVELELLFVDLVHSIL